MRGTRTSMRGALSQVRCVSSDLLWAYERECDEIMGVIAVHPVLLFLIPSGSLIPVVGSCL